MKKLIFTALAFATLINVGNAQNMPEPKTYKAIFTPSKIAKKSYNKAVVSGWYSHLAMAQASNIGGGLTISAALSNSDSLFKSINSDNSIDYNFWMSSFGSVLDPKDDIIDLTDNPELKLTRFSRYTLDSVAFRYLYVRNVDSVVNPSTSQNVAVVDTLFITYYKNAQITKTNFTGGAMDKVALVNYTAARRFPSNFTKTDTFLLTPNNPYIDTTLAQNTGSDFENSFYTKTAVFPAPANFSCNAGDLVGFVYTFKSGIKSVLNGDTAIMNYGKDPSTFTGRRANYFGTFLWSNAKSTGTPWSNPTYHNSYLFQPGWSSYGQNANWNGRYVVGSAFAADFFLDNQLHLTSANASTQELANEVFGMGNVYPNPTAYGSSATVSFDLKKNGTVSVNVYSITGQLVKTIAPKSVTVGTHTQELDLAGLKAGIYLVNMTVNGVSETRKLTITE